MGATNGEFVKYPRTPHLFSAAGTKDDKRLNNADSVRIIADQSLIVEEKIDGTNVGLHFSAQDELILQCRGHLITEGMHPQYDLFKQWAHVKRPVLQEKLERRYILFGEWVYARHTIFYRGLTHYFFEFDIYDKQSHTFLDLRSRLQLLAGSGIQTVPVLHTGPISRKQLQHLIGPSRFDSQFADPSNGLTDNRMEGLYLRTESRGQVTARAKCVRPEFTERIKLSSHWQRQPMRPNQLAQHVDIWS